MADYVCNKCGAAAYYDGRYGDGPILTCGCDKRGEPHYDARMGSVDVWYNTDARPVESNKDWDERR